MEFDTENCAFGNLPGQKKSKDTHELRPCPFCGNEKLETNWHGNYHSIWCKNCEVHMSLDDEPYVDKLDAKWNKRSGEDELKQEIKLLESDLDDYQEDRDENKKLKQENEELKSKNVEWDERCGTLYQKVDKFKEQLRDYENVLKVYAMAGMWDKLKDKWSIFRSEYHGFTLAKDILGKY